MLVSRQDIIALKKLGTTRDFIPVDSIPVAFKAEFQSYFLGKTFVKKDDTLCAYPHDIKNWIHYLFTKYRG